MSPSAPPDPRSHDARPNAAAMQRGAAQRDARADVFVERVRGLLVPGEQIEAWAIQRRLFALTHRRLLVVATTGRLLVFTRNLVAGYTMDDIRWQDLSTVHIRVGLFGADLGIGYHEGTDLAGGADRPPLWRTVRGLRPAQAQQVYRISQAHDQAWREKRRIRDLEEMRARAGGVQIGGGAVLGGALPAAGAVSSLDDMTARLQRAKDMVDKGLITDAEYEAIKAKLIAGF